MVGGGNGMDVARGTLVRCICPLTLHHSVLHVPHPPQGDLSAHWMKGMGTPSADRRANAHFCLQCTALQWRDETYTRFIKLGTSAHRFLR